MKRRALLTGAAATAALPFSTAQESGAGFVDSNVYLGEWPFRKLPHSGARELEPKLKSLGITEARTGSFEALFHRDLDAANATLSEQCQDTIFLPYGAINPTLPNWERSLRRIKDEFGMRGIRLHPNYHGYSLDDPRFIALLQSAEKNDLPVQIAIRMEDVRTQHPKVSVPDVDTRPLPESLRAAPGVRVQLLNALGSLRDSMTLERLGKLGVSFEIAMLEGIEGVRNQLDRAPNARLQFGSYAPFFSPEAALLKLQESILTDTELTVLKTGVG
ncbi:MAG: hypothetical protein P1U87_02170 [Verrucomicrobiales bacterium]|nr:hypothetical protein [Verrucomicrobiales bacterium]